MPTQYIQTPSSLSQRDSHSNETFTHAHALYPYPRTPYPTIPETEEWSAPPHDKWNNAADMTQIEAGRSARRHFNASPISSAELRRVLDSLFDQVDWLEVAVKVASNRAPSIYCNAVEKILLAYIDQLAKIEDEDDDATQVETSIDDKSSMLTFASDNEEGDSDFIMASEDEEGDSDEDGDNSEDMEEDRDKDSEVNDVHDEDSEEEY